MQPTPLEGIFKKQNKLFTENLKDCKGIAFYNEKIVSYKDISSQMPIEPLTG